jgi:D-serine deaminase-like pyridoxal phosphate-dependent protein
VLLEIGFPNGRTGCRSAEQALEVARAVAAAPGLRLRGVAAFEGIVAAPGTPGAREKVTAFLVEVRRVAQRLHEAGLVDGELLLSAGGSAYFDLVVEAFTANHPARIVLRSGSYAAHETGPHAGLSPFARAPHTGRSLLPALELWGQVLSRPEPDRALLGFGRRSTSFDVALPDPTRVRHAGEPGAGPLTGASTTALDDEHAYLRVPPDQRLGIGDWVGFGQAHPCTAFDKWKLVAVVENDHVVDVIRTFF